MTMASIGPESAALYGLSVIKNCGIYQDGITNSNEKTIRVGVTYERLKEANRVNRRMLVTQVASECPVSRNFVRKIECELVIHGRCRPP